MGASISLDFPRKSRRPRQALPTANAKPEVQYSEATKVVHRNDDLMTLDRVNQYSIHKLLGRGSYGSVYQAVDAEGQLVAIKVLDFSLLKRKPALHERVLQDSMREIAVMKRVLHPHCVQLFEVIDDVTKDRSFLVMEMLQGGTVLETANLPPSLDYLPESCARVVFRDLLLGLEYLHSNGILHRDIKPENMVYVKRPPWSRTVLGSKQRVRKSMQTVQRTASVTNALTAAAEEASRKQAAQDAEEQEAHDAAEQAGKQALDEISTYQERQRRKISMKQAGVGMRANKIFSSRTSHGIAPTASLGEASMTGAVDSLATDRRSSGNGESSLDHVALSFASDSSGNIQRGSKTSCNRKQKETTPGPSLDEFSVQERYATATIKLLDFGVAHMCEISQSVDASGKEIEYADDAVKTATGTPAFFAPEMCRKGGYNGFKADMWAAGVTLCLISGGALPFAADNMPEMFRRIQEEPPRLPPKASKPLIKLLNQLLAKEPELRPTWTALRQNSWLTKDETFPLPENLNLNIQVSEDDIRNAFSTFGSALTVVKLKSKLMGRVNESRASKLAESEQSASFAKEVSDVTVSDDASPGARRKVSFKDEASHSNVSLVSSEHVLPPPIASPSPALASTASSCTRRPSLPAPTPPAPAPSQGKPMHPAMLKR
eukprot:CAMPEP_0119316916 /NCGR_PEP_ID=MMETSP1333-20130426/41358_1 /TAXON_ID=418940 /ORGANISM="Scyphosphaera apsteinii, Strain RCC1455" /LENGTH=660 /DNA_ID=CAMNT_0007322697 /DNA_START=34 /DNA_END=2016 /DNA_ORIENTATION=-